MEALRRDSRTGHKMHERVEGSVNLEAAQNSGAGIWE